MSDAKREGTGAAHRGDEDAARAANVRRSAWLLAGIAVLVYVGYMVWFLIRGGA